MSVHVVAPGTFTTAWCGGRDAFDGDVTDAGVVDCPACLQLLCDSPQYYNRLRQKGLRSLEEDRWEKREAKRNKKVARKSRARTRRKKKAARKASSLAPKALGES